jgi:ferredoxin-NADP reductase/ferredoxin
MFLDPSSWTLSMSLHAIALHTRDGAVVSFPCAETQTVVSAAAQAGFTLPILCGEGGCGVCRATCRDGDYVLGPHSAAALPAEAAAAHDILLCRTFPRSPLTLSAPFARAEVGTQAVPVRRARILALEPTADRVVRLLLAVIPGPDGDASATFEPGQYMELSVPGRCGRRAYSLANTANWDGRLEFFIRLHPDGWFSRYLSEEAAPGAELEVRGPLGGFTLTDRGLAPRWFVAGGTGLAPLLSMLRRMAEWQEPQPARLYFGVGCESDLFALDQIEALRADLPGFTVEPCVWQPQPGWQGGFAGTPVEALRRDLATAKALPDLYVCGPAALVDGVSAVAAEAGIPADRVAFERFLPV